jgi:hypothetical protein
MQYIAEFLGASILNSETAPRSPSRTELARKVEEFSRAASQHSPSPDEEHKMILLLEYLCRCAIPLAHPLRTARA